MSHLADLPLRPSGNITFAVNNGAPVHRPDEKMGFVLIADVVRHLKK